MAACELPHGEVLKKLTQQASSSVDLISPPGTWLEKRSVLFASLKAWRRRYFTFDFNEGKLCYYSDAKCKRLRGRLLINDRSTILPLPPSGSRKFIFVARGVCEHADGRAERKPGYRSLMISCPDSETMMRWMEVLMASARQGDLLVTRDFMMAGSSQDAAIEIITPDKVKEYQARYDAKEGGMMLVTFFLGVAYRFGLGGVEQDLERAAVLFSESNNPGGNVHLASMLFRGQLALKPGETRLSQESRAMRLLLTTMKMQCPIMSNFHVFARDFDSLAELSGLPSSVSHLCKEGVLLLVHSLDPTLVTAADLGPLVLQPDEALDLDLDLAPQLGSGAFGSVVAARIRGVDSAVKLLTSAHDEEASSQVLYRLWTLLHEGKTRDKSVVRSSLVDFAMEGGPLLKIGAFAAEDRKHVVGLVALRAVGKHAPMMALERCDGTLEGYVEKKRGKLRVSEKIELMRQCAEGVRVLHEHLLLHNDVKADNYLMREGIVKLSDFGLAKDCAVLNGGLEDRAVVQGHPKDTKFNAAIAAPEVKHQLLFSVRSDVYALGILFWSLLWELSGPAHKRGVKVLLYPKLVPHQDLCQGGAHACPVTHMALEALIHRCLQPESVDRPTVIQVIEELKKMLELEEVMNDERLLPKQEPVVLLDMSLTSSRSMTVVDGYKVNSEYSKSGVTPDLHASGVPSEYSQTTVAADETEREYMVQEVYMTQYATLLIK